MNDVIEHQIRRWLQDFVVALNLCPFARPLLDKPTLRIAVCHADDAAVLRSKLLYELDYLQRSTEQEVATTLLAFPCALSRFSDYLLFFEEAQALLKQAGLEGIVQLASFHPHYCFAGELPHAASQFSNRAPYPLVHLLREDMLSRVLETVPAPHRIPEQNIATLEAIGVDEMQRRWQRLFC